MKKRKEQEKIPLDPMGETSSEGSPRSIGQEPEIQFGHKPVNSQKYPSDRSYSMNPDADDIQTIRRLQSRNIMIPGVNGQSLNDLRRRQSSLVHPRRMSCHTQPLEDQVQEIYAAIEHDDCLMGDDPLAQQMRLETLRKMPASLTMKRSLKRKLGNSMNLKSRRAPLSLWKRVKYRLSMYLTKLKMGVKDIFYVMELWYGSIKTIEGHFGTSTATYFRFLRWLFSINCIVFAVSFGFLVIPQLLLHLYDPAFRMKNASSKAEYLANSNVSEPETIIYNISDPYQTNEVFSIGNLFTGEGWLENTELYYGFYCNHSVSLISNYKYSIPGSYIFTLAFCYIFTFFVVATSAAKSYRKSYIETGSGVKHVYSHKLFCGWDFGIATEQGASLKRQSLFNEFKELLDEEAEKLEKEHTSKSFVESLTTLSLQMFVNFIVIVLLGSTGLLIWTLLSLHKQWEDSEQNSDISDGNVKVHTPTITVSLSITLILLFVPMFFSYVTRFERYRSPKKALYVTLWRTFGLEVVVLCILLAFWLHSPDGQCWETSLGQEIYRLVIMDFLITVCGTSAAELIRSRIYMSVWEKIGMPEFDIARNTLILIYNQTLFWIGFFFSPLLALIIVIKMFITFYIKKIGVMSHCQPSSRAWRAAQTETIFLVLSFLSQFGVLFALGFVFTRVPTSDCGPFRGYDYMYQMVLKEILTISEESTLWNILSYSMRPGVVGCVLVSMCVAIYYVRAVAMARVKMVKILREMLVLESKDKEYLIANIFRFSDDRPRFQGEYMVENSNTWKFHRSSPASDVGEDWGEVTRSSNM